MKTASSSAGPSACTRVRLPPKTDAELLIVNSARVSFSKESTSLSDADRSLIRFLHRQSHWTPFGHPQLALEWPTSRVRLDRLLLSRKNPTSTIAQVRKNAVVERGSLWHWLTHKHEYDHLEPDIDRALWQWVPTVCGLLDVPKPVEPYPLATPFEVRDEWVAEDIENRAGIPWMTVVIEAPIPIRTQLFKHKYGFVENEISRRYVDSAPEFYYPPIWRERAPSLKQGSKETPVRFSFLADFIARAVYTVSRLGYSGLLRLGVCPEQSRFLLSQGMMTQWYWTGSVDAIHRACSLRLKPDTQEETRWIMQQVKTLTEERWPLTCQKLFSRPWNERTRRWPEA